MQNILFYVDIGTPVKQAYIKGKSYFAIQIHREYSNIWFCVERETQHWFQFRFSLN